MGRLVDIGGYRIPFYTAAILYPAGVIVTAQCKLYWQAVLSQALLSVSVDSLDVLIVRRVYVAGYYSAQPWQSQANGVRS
jgi:hypothetical protein